MIPEGRFERVRRGGRRAEQRADRQAALLRRTLKTLDDLAEEIETELDRRDR